MEAQEFVNFLKNNLKTIIFAGIIFGMCGLIVFYSTPTKFVAVGTLFVKRSVNSAANEFFTYEGYYGQQAAVSYTSSVVALIQSEDIRSQALNKMGANINEPTLRELNRKLSTKKTGPQVIEVIVKDKNRDSALLIWQSITNALIETNTQLNTTGDYQLSIQLVQPTPVIREVYRHQLMYFATFALLGIGMTTLVLGFKQYLS